MKTTTLMTKKDQDKNWWSRPLLGKQTLWGILTQPIGQEESSAFKNILSLHNQALAQTHLFAEAINSRNSQYFKHPEFTTFLRMRNKLARQVGEYKYLLPSIKLLSIGLQFKDIFFVLGNIENRYQGFQEQNFYDFVNDLIEQHLSKDDFIKELELQFPSYIAVFNDSHTINVLKSYKKAIEILAENETGLQLLNKLKTNQINYVIFLHKIIETIDQLKAKDALDNLVVLEIFVNRNISFFKQVNKIIDVPNSNNNYAKNMALVLQFVALETKYQKTYLEFREFLDLLNQWQKAYQVIVTIREKYRQFTCPEFKEEIPGLELYQEYLNCCQSLLR